MRPGYVLDTTAVCYISSNDKLEILAQTDCVVNLPFLSVGRIAKEYAAILAEYEGKGVVEYDFCSEEEMAELYEFHWELRENIEGLDVYDTIPIYVAKKRGCPLLTGDESLLAKARGIPGLEVLDVKEVCNKLNQQLVDRSHTMATIALRGAGEESYV